MGKRKSSAETAKLGSDIRVGTPKNGAHTKPAKQPGKHLRLFPFGLIPQKKLWYKVETVCFWPFGEKSENAVRA